MLSLLCGDILTQDEFYKISTAIELFHQATLIFDDILDDTDIRDGNRIALHNKLGNNNSAAGKANYLAGILMILAEKELIENSNIDIVSEFNIMRIEMLKAQLADVFFVEKPQKTSYLNWLLNESYKRPVHLWSFLFLFMPRALIQVLKK